MAVAVPLDPSALSVFRDAFAGEVVLPNDDGYDAARAVWNGMIDRRPVLIVRPTTVRDVAAAVRFARERDLVVAVRGGGHSIAVELVTADGRSVRASEDQNPDLFWALRGAGANFGIATAFEFRLHPFDGQVTHGFVVHPGERAVELVRLYRELLETSPDELFLGFDLGMATPEDDLPPEVAGRPVATIGVCHSGSPEQGERDLGPLRAFGPPLLDSIQPKAYLDMQRGADEAMDWGHRFYMKSGFTATMPDELVELWVGLTESAPPGGCSIGAWPWDRAIWRVSDDDMAFTGRAARFWLAVESQWDDPSLDDEIRDWTRHVYDTVTPYRTTGRYVNDVVESGDDVIRSVYGDAKYERLVALKCAWDPDNLFRMNQNIRP
jgi:hypothetical protein